MYKVIKHFVDLQDNNHKYDVGDTYPRKGLNVLLGSDYTAFRYSPQGIPVKKAFLGVNLGVSVPIGQKQ